MRKLVFSIALISVAAVAMAQQVPNADFEDWSAPAFKNCPQPAGWNASNVEQFGLKFNFAHREAGHTGCCLMVQDQSIGAMGVKETSPGYFSLGQPWVFIETLFKVKYATAGTYGGIKWTCLPDTMSVWIRRTGDNTDKEDFYLLYYSWSGEAQGNSYKNKNGSCTEVTHVNEESDIRQALNGNECGTTQKATQIAEGMWRERKTYQNWTNIRVPIYYMSSKTPTMMNLIFSASNYPNFRANTGLYAGNSLYVDDIEFIYANTVQKVTLDGKTWTGFDPQSADVQRCVLPASATDIPKVECWRGEGKLTNARGNTVHFKGRKLGSRELTVEQGILNTKPMKITVHSADGKTSRQYQILFVNR